MNILGGDQFHFDFRIPLNQREDDCSFYSSADENGVALGAAERRVLRCNFDSLFGFEFFEDFEGF